MAQTFGSLFRQLRVRRGLTQQEVANRLGYSRSLVAALELNHRLPDLNLVVNTMVPLLCERESREVATRLVELAAISRNVNPPEVAAHPRIRAGHASFESAADVYRVAPAPTEMLGRAFELETFCNRFLERGDRLITLVGPPGVGKTRLAIEIAQNLQYFFAQGAAFVPLASLDSPEQMATAISLGLQAKLQVQGDPLARLIVFLRHKEILLLLDNFEGLMKAAPQIATLLSECPDLRVLVTSRERLHLRAERVAHVAPLASHDAADLFMQRANASGGDLDPSALDRPLVERICRQLDSLPLAIELCAWQADYYTLEEIHNRLVLQPLEMLNNGAKDLPAHQRSLRAAIQLSWDLLEANERRLLCTLSVFRGGCELVALEKVASPDPNVGDRTTRDVLRLLIAKSLVQPVTTARGERRFDLLESVAAFAYERLVEMFDSEAVCERHYYACLDSAREADTYLRRGEAALWSAKLDLEIDNFRSAIAWAFARQRYTEVAWMIFAIQFYCHHRGLLEEAAQWCERLFPFKNSMDIDVYASVKGCYIYKIATLQKGDAIRSAIPELRSLADACTMPMVRSNLMRWIAAYAPDHESACAAYKEAIITARVASPSEEEIKDYGIQLRRDIMLPKCLLNYAIYLIEQGDAIHSAGLAVEAEGLYRSYSNLDGIIHSLAERGRIALLRGENSQALALFSQSVELGRKSESLYSLAQWQPYLGLAALRTGALEEARFALESGRNATRRYGAASLEAIACAFLAEDALLAGRSDAAAVLMAESVVLDREALSAPFFQILRIVREAEPPTG